MTSNNYWKVIPQFAPLNGLHADICILYRCSTNRAPLHFLHILDKHLESGNTLKNSLKSFFWNVDSDVLQILHLILNERSLGKETPAILIFSLYAEGEKKRQLLQVQENKILTMATLISAESANADKSIGTSLVLCAMCKCA